MCFFKQKTAYEMRISDWSSDVCSSDLGLQRPLVFAHVNQSGGVLGAKLQAQPRILAPRCRLLREWLQQCIAGFQLAGEVQGAGLGKAQADRCFAVGAERALGGGARVPRDREAGLDRTSVV